MSYGTCMCLNLDYENITKKENIYVFLGYFSESNIYMIYQKISPLDYLKRINGINILTTLNNWSASNLLYISATRFIFYSKHILIIIISWIVHRKRFFLYVKSMTISLYQSFFFFGQVIEIILYFLILCWLIF